MFKSVAILKAMNTLRQLFFLFQHEVILKSVPFDNIFTCVPHHMHAQSLSDACD